MKLDRKKQKKLRVNRHLTGLTGEYLVAAELARRDFTVALPTGSAAALDIMAYKDGRHFSVQVKSASGDSIQLNLGKFLEIEMDGDRQIVRGVRPEIDENMIVVVVFVAKLIGEDKFFCTKMGIFTQFLMDSHNEYLNRYNGIRPGPNKTSMHAAHKKSSFKNEKFFTIDEQLNLVMA